ncbi:MAG: DUF5683 domain-containing protein [Gemmatimonadaceae bacterium]|nr:DUF5683 domain-containing protein [Gemmatimonadaceae bacterium]
MQRLVPALLLTVHVAALSPLSSQELEDVVYLKDGSTVRGTVIERIVGESVKIQVRDGSVQVYAMGRIARIVKEPATVGKEEVEPGFGSRHTSVSGAQRKPRNPWLASGLSAVIPGTGQFYNGQYLKGVPQLGAATAGSALVFLAARDNYEDIYGYWVDPDNDDRNAVYGGVLWLGGLLWSVIDAPISANRINREAQPGSEDLGVTLDLGPALRSSGTGVRLVIRY